MTDDIYDVNTARPYHHGDLRRALVEAAFDILKEEGREALTLRAVGKRAGVSAMAPYRHFPDKAALLAAVAGQGFAMLRQAQGAVDDPADPRRTLVELAVVLVRFARDHPDLFRLMYGADPVGGDAADLAARPDTAYGLLTARLSALVPEDQIEAALLSVWSFSHGLASLVMDGRLRPMPADVEAMTRRAAEFLVERIASGA